MSSTTRYQVIDEVLRDAVASGAVPHVVAIAADRAGVIYEGGAGPRSPGEDVAVTGDTRFRIMSMTKVVVTVAALALMEQLKLDLDAPVEEYCPKFADVQVLERIDGGRPITRPPAAKATVGQLITHTSGLGYWFWNASVRAWEQAVDAPNVLSGSDGVFDAPMVADPGTEFIYGISTDWLGKVVEAASGRGLDDVVRHAVTEPLGMTDTGFALTDEQRGAVAPVHLQTADGRWAAGEVELQSDPDYWSAGHGLYSTPRDYLKFQRMLLGDGTSPDGVTLLAPETVQNAFANQIGVLDFPAAISTADPASAFGMEVGPGYKWGHGLLVNLHDEPGRRRAGSGAWTGFFNTHFWVDRAAGVTGAIYTQLLPFLPPPALQMYRDFETALYAERPPR
jgi:methyl acetate hydrolase